MNVDEQLSVKYGLWLDRKLKGKPAPEQIIQRRTLNTAITVVSTVQDISFTKMSCALYFLCKDIEVNFFPRLYESQLELAGANPDASIRGLHKFYKEVERKIKKEDLYQVFFEFISSCSRARYSEMGKDDEESNSVLDCYHSLLLQQLEYLRPSKFDLTQVLCGRTTYGELMSIKDTYPFLDTPANEIEQIYRSSKREFSAEEFDKLVVSTYRKHGFNINTFDDVNPYTQADRIFTNHQCALIPYINEMTFDMLPDPERPFPGLVFPLYTIAYHGVTAAQLKEGLKKRAHTLPSNGVKIDFSYETGAPENISPVTMLKMKEMLYDDRVIMLYKLDTPSGELCGFFDTKDSYFSSILLESNAEELYEMVETLVLYLYSTKVLRNGAELQADFGNVFCFHDPSSHKDSEIKVEIYGRAGKPENVYRKSPYNPTGKRAGNDAYESEPRSIQGFVRKVGAGRHPSQEARERAAALGYDLADDETYVQPFVKTVLKLKSAK